jgi:hypothetical protein
MSQPSAITLLSMRRSYPAALDPPACTVEPITELQHLGREILSHRQLYRLILALALVGECICLMILARAW